MHCEALASSTEHKELGTQCDAPQPTAAGHTLSHAEVQAAFAPLVSLLAQHMLCLAEAIFVRLHCQPPGLHLVQISPLLIGSCHILQ